MIELGVSELTKEKESMYAQSSWHTCQEPLKRNRKARVQAGDGRQKEERNICDGLCETENEECLSAQ